MTGIVNTGCCLLVFIVGIIGDSDACVGLLYSGVCYSVSDDIGCVNIGGKCQSDSTSCDGGYVSGECGGPSGRRCCKPAPSGDYNCLKIGGFCQTNTETCHDNQGTYVSGKCGGPNNRQCCMDPPSCSARIISRQGWGARTPTSETSLSGTMSRVFIHHTAGYRCYNTPDCSSVVRGTQNYHMDSKGWSDIGYSFLVGDDGFVYEGRGWNTQGAHTSGYNNVAYGIAFMGDFTSTAPSDRALIAAQNLTACAVSLGKLSSNYDLQGHRDVGTTTCPGTTLYNIIKQWPNYLSP